MPAALFIPVSCFSAPHLAVEVGTVPIQKGEMGALEISFFAFSARGLPRLVSSCFANLALARRWAGV
jgi:hypothetical protein